MLLGGERAAREALNCIASVSDPLRRCDFRFAAERSAGGGSCGRMTLAMCAADVGDLMGSGGGFCCSFHESRLGRGGSSRFRLTTFGLGAFVCSGSSGFPFDVPGLLLLLEVDLRRFQLRQPCAEPLASWESWLRRVVVVRRDSWDGARLNERLAVPGKTYSLMLSRMLRERLGGRTAVDGRACGFEASCCFCFSRSWRIHSVAWASATAAGFSGWVGFLRCEELL